MDNTLKWTAEEKKCKFNSNRVAGNANFPSLILGNGQRRHRGDWDLNQAQKSGWGLENQGGREETLLIVERQDSITETTTRTVCLADSEERSSAEAGRWVLRTRDGQGEVGWSLTGEASPYQAKEFGPQVMGNRQPLKLGGGGLTLPKWYFSNLTVELTMEWKERAYMLVAWSRSGATRALPSADPVGMERETRRGWTKKK